LVSAAAAPWLPVLLLLRRSLDGCGGAPDCTGSSCGAGLPPKSPLPLPLLLLLVLLQMLVCCGRLLWRVMMGQVQAWGVPLGSTWGLLWSNISGCRRTDQLFLLLSVLCICSGHRHVFVLTEMPPRVNTQQTSTTKSIQTQKQVGSKPLQKC
jgi:hypothetical protein